jgi:3-deoxy-manno-octulosonate cytidylyltransferase (CMP-KDO synthetase)
MSFTVIIPARFSSTRLPGKPLKDIAGKPMIQHVYEQAKKSAAREVIVATDDERIKTVAEGFGARVCMTAVDHESGTDRLQEVVAQLGYGDDEVIVNVQGDEPLIPPSNINQVAELLLNSPNAGIATLSERIDNVADVFDPNAVKVVSNATNSALYFSRSPLPWVRDDFNGFGGELPDQLPAGVDFQRHIGIYGYRVGLLHEFVTWPPAPLELAESLEQLRAMWNGVDIKVAQAVETPPAGVDTEADLERVRALLA